MNVIKVLNRNGIEKEYTSVDNLSTHDKIFFICEKCGNEGSTVKSKFTGCICKKCKLSLLDRSKYKKANRDNDYYSRIAKKRSSEDFEKAKITRENTLIEKYGTNNVMKVDLFKDNFKKSFMSIYGVDSPLKLELTREKNKEKKFNEVIERLKSFNVKPMFSFKEYYGARGIDIIYKWKCLKCNNEFESNYYDSKLIPRCPICNPILIGTSSGEKEMECFIGDSVKYKDKWEIDCYIEEKKIGFEFDGLYWHSDLFKSKNYHLEKTNYFINKDIRIYHIFEDEWEEKKDIVKSIINTKLNKFDETIFARKCSLELVKSTESKKFQDENHIQGKSSSSVNIGLYYKNELVSLMTFGKCRFGNYDWELVRFVNKKNTKIIGGASKLFSYFTKKYNPKSIVSYSDIRLFDGGLYEVLKFKKLHSTPPQYYYTKFGKRYNRMNFQKKYLKDKLALYNENLTEYENMKNNGFNRIYDCGVIVWVFILMT